MPSIHAYQDFLLQRKADLRRVANSTRRAAELTDVEQEAWVAGTVFEARWSHFFDFTVEANQELVIGYLYNEFVTFAEKTNRYAESIDRDEEENRSFNRLDQLSFSLSNADPLIALQSEEDDMQITLARAQSSSYSEAVAYALLLARFKSDLTKLASFLQIVVSTLRERLDRAVLLMKVQPTLFDGVETIEPDFTPTPGKRYRKKNGMSLGEQELLQLDFAADLRR